MQACLLASRGRGKDFFLVDRKTRNVFGRSTSGPRNASPDELNRTAERVINQLKRDLKPARTAS